MKLIGLAELAELYGVSKNTANTWSRQRDWPAPVATLKMGPVWDQDEVEAHKTPAGKQRFEVRCAHCYSDSVHSPGMNLNGGFIVECANCGQRSRFKIAQVQREADWPTVIISAIKEEA